ncbi:MAG: hypothetical protein WCH62_05365 [Candidatus Omnitrophota bacterium]
MRKIIILMLIAMVGSISPCTAAEEFKKEASISLSRYNFGDDEAKKNVMMIGEKVVFKINAYIEDFFNQPIINANAKIINLTDDPMQVLYVITFYDDQNNIIGAHAMNWTLKPKEDINYGSGLIKGKEEDFKRVVKYKVYVCSYQTVPDKK